MNSPSENKKFAPPRTPPSLSDGDRARAVEKLYIYPNATESDVNTPEPTFTTTAGMVGTRKKEEEDKDYIYNFSGHEHNINRKVCDTDFGLPTPEDKAAIKKLELEKAYNYTLRSEPTVLRRRRGSYKTNAVQNRMRVFAQDFFEHGFNYGTRVKLPELKYWIEALELAHDRVTVQQYVKRLCMHGYFYLESNGSFTFLTDLPGQLTLPVMQKQRKRLRAIASDHRIKRRSY